MREPEVLAVVQARAGSKGLPGKNVRMLLGKPLMAWIIEAARASRRVSRVILSTDSQEYAAIGRRHGVEVPFLRPTELAQDTSTDLEVMTHAISWLKEKEGYRPDLVLRLQPTNPTFPSHLIDAGIELLLSDPQADSVRPVTLSPKHPYKMWRWSSHLPVIEPLLSPEGSGFREPFSVGRKMLPPILVQVGAMEALRIETLLRQRSMAGKKILGLWVEDPLLTVNIDMELDFLLAEAALRKLLARAPVPASQQVGSHGPF